jgi:hypothetical protein
MKKCAVILNGSDVVKVLNLKRKYDKFVNNPTIKILEECDEEELEEKYSYWCQTVNNKPKEQTESLLKYHWRNKITGWTRHSINPELGADANSDEWEPYEIS